MPYTDDPANVATDRVRFLCGDTDNNHLFLSDNEVAYALAEQPIPVYAAAACADAIANKLSARVDKTIGKTSLRLSQQAEAFRKTAERLRNGGPGNLPGGDGSGERVGGIFVGGVSISGNQDLRNDTTIEQPSFSIGQDDSPGVPLNRSGIQDWED